MPRLPLPWGMMSFTDTGSAGTPLVLLHGTGCDSADWDGVAGCLPPSVRTIRPDFRGHGESDVPDRPFTIDDLADDLLALADHLALPAFVPVGHSLGGMVALAAAARSDRIAMLVLLEGWSNLEASRAFRGDRLYGRLPAGTVESIREKSARTMARFDETIWDAFWDSMRSFDAGPWLASTQRLVVEVYGELGRTEETLPRLGVPDRENIRVVWLPGAGHYLPHEAPRAVADILASVAENPL